MKTTILTWILRIVLFLTAGLFLGAASVPTLTIKWRDSGAGSKYKATGKDTAAIPSLELSGEVGHTYKIQVNHGRSSWEDSITLTLEKQTTEIAWLNLSSAEVTFYRAVDLGKVADVKVPSWTSGSKIEYARIDAESMQIRWPAAEDDVGIYQYSVYLGNELLGTVLANNRSMLLPLADDRQMDQLSVVAIDPSGKSSPKLLSASPLPVLGMTVVVDDGGYVYEFHKDESGAWTALKEVVRPFERSRGVAVADFDEDGVLDFITGYHYDGYFRMKFFKGKPDGTFITMRSLPVIWGCNDWIMDMCAADFDGDGHQDFIVNGNFGGNYSRTAFYWGNGDGTFSVTSENLGEYGRGMDAGDINNDGYMDFVRTSHSSGIVKVYLSNGDRTFTSSATAVGDAGDDPYGLTVGDFDEDGHLDVITNSGSSGDITYFKGNGNATFQAGIGIAKLDINNYSAMDSYDYNQDGHLDIVLNGYSNRNVYFWPGVGDGTFGERVTIAGQPKYSSLGISSPPIPGEDVVIDLAASAAVNDTVTFNATGTEALDGDTYTWNFGDGSTAEGKTVTHAYTSEGSWIVRLWHTNASGKKTLHADTIRILGQPPVANTGGPYVLDESKANAMIWKLSPQAALSTDDAGIARYEWQIDLSALGQGLLCEIFTGDWTSIPDFNSLTPYNSIYTTKLDLSVDSRRDYLGLRFRGQILAESEGTYTFYTSSDDHSTVMIDGSPVMENFGTSDRHGWIYLSPGWHEIEILYFERTGGEYLTVTWTTPGGNSKTSIPAANLRPVVTLRGINPSIYLPDFPANAKVPLTLTVTDNARQSHTDSTTVSHTLGNPPVAVITAPDSIDEKNALAGNWTVALSAEASSDAETSIWKYEWNFGNNTTGTGVKPTATYTAPGTYTITLKVYDQAGQSHTTTKEIQVKGNDDPVAVITAPATLDETSATNGVWSYQFSAAASSDDFGIWKYAWDFGNGTTSTLKDPSTAFSSAGEYTITLTVTDNAGQSNSTKHLLTVKANERPVAAFSGPETLEETSSAYGGFRGVWDASASTDDRGIYLYQWDFGDHTPPRAGKTIAHTYANAGEYDLTLTVTDFGRQTASLTKRITVQYGQPPVAAFSYAPTEVEGTSPVTFDASASSDDTQIASYTWYLPPIQFPFYGKQIDATQWKVSNGTQEESLFFKGNATWNSSYFYNISSTALKRGGTLEGVVATPTSGGLAMFGIKNRDFSTGDYRSFIYAVYFALGEIQIYEYGNNRGKVASFLPGNTYDVRIDTKLNGGAVYYMRPHGTDQEYTKIYESNNYTDTWMSFGADIYSGAFRFDDIKVTGLVYRSKMAYLPPNVRPDVWTISHGTYTNAFEMTAPGGWNRCYFFHHQLGIARGGTVEGVLYTPGDSGSTHAMVGFKGQNFSTGDYSDLIHCFYFDNGTLSIYEYGYKIATVGTYSKGQAYDFKIVSKIPRGAIYYYRVHDSGQEYTKAYESNGYSDALMSVGGDFYSYSWRVEDLLVTGAVVEGKTFNTAVFPGGEMLLEVTDRVNQSHTTTLNIPVITDEKPVAKITGPTINQSGSRLHRFEAGLSSDDHGIASYSWDFGDGSPLESGPVVNHYFQKAGVFTVTLTVYDYAGQSATDTFEMEIFGDNAVVCVPWRIIGEVELPHETWEGKEITLKAVADASVKVPFTWTWDFGDGSPVLSGSVSTAADLYNLQAIHAFSGRAGVPFYATITVIDKDNNLYLDTYPVILRNKTLDVEMNVAIDEGLWYLHKTQTRYDVDSQHRGGWWRFSNYYTGFTASALQAFFVNGHLETGDANQDPYVTTVIRGMNDLFTRLKTYNIDLQTYGDPDSNGNGIGISVNEGVEIYQLGQVMDAIVAGGRPDLIARTGPANVKGRTYREIVQDMVDQYAWGQHDGETVGGGWRYSWGEHPDNSAAQWGAIGLYAAEYHFGCTVPQWVKDRNVVWLNYSYDDYYGTFGYTAKGAYEATTPSGLVQLAWNKIPTSDSRWIKAESYLAKPSNSTYNFASNKNNNNIYPLYALAKAMRLAYPEPVTKFKSTGLEWFTDNTNGLARYLLNMQSNATDANNLPYFGSFYFRGGYVTGHDYPTAWSVIMLSSSLFRQAPVAVINASPNPASVGQLVTLDARGSYHQDPSYKIVEYRWDFDDSDGVDMVNPDGIGPVVTYAFSKVKTYTITLRVTDNHTPPDYDTESYVFNVTQPPHPPTADAGGPYLAAKGEDIRFNGSGSFDIDIIDGDSITSWDWELDYVQPLDFDDQDTEGNRATGEIFTYKGGFALPGLYNIALRVTDNARKIYPESTATNLTGEDYTTVRVYEKIVSNLTARSKGGKCQLTWTYPDAYKTKDLRAVIYRSETGPNSGHYEIGQSTSKYATFLDTKINTNQDYYYRLLIYQKGSNTPIGVSNVEFVYSRDRGDKNGPPVITSIPIYLAQSGQSYQYQVEARDRESDTLYYSLLQGPEGMGIDAITGLVKFTPTADQRGIHKIGVEVRETRSGGSFDRQYWDLVVDTGENRAPVVAINGPYQAILGQAVSFSSAGTSDPDADELSYLWNFGDGKSSSQANPVYTYTADGEYVVLLVVNDGKGGTAKATTRVRIYRPNRPPEIKVRGGPSFLVRALATLTVDASATRDLDGDAMSFTWNWGDGTTETTSSIGTHTYASRADYAGTLTVSDVRGGVSVYPFTVKVGPPNQLPVPVITVITPGREVGDTWLFDGTNSTDPDHDTLRYSWNFGDAYHTTGDAVTHAYRAPGNYTVTLTVDDGNGGVVQTTYSLHINAPPKVTSNPPPSVNEDTLFTYTLAANDADGDPVAFLLTKNPSGMTLLGNTISWTPGNADVGTHTVSVDVIDQTNGTITQHTFQLKVVNVNDAPVIFSVPPTNMVLEKPFQYKVNAYDVDGDPIVYSIAGAPAQMTIDAATGIINWQAAPSDENKTISFSVSATDPFNAKATQNVSVKVLSGKQPPEARAGADQRVFVGQDVTVDGSSSSDPNGDPITYQWSFRKVPDKSTYKGLGATAVGFTFKPDRQGLYEIELVVNDGQLWSAPDVVVIEATNAPVDLEPSLIDPSQMTIDPVSLAIGGRVEIRVGNPGGKSQKQPYSVTVFLDTDYDGKYTEGLDWLLGGMNQDDIPDNTYLDVLGIPVSGTAQFLGNFVYAFVDSKFQVAETSEENNVINTAPVCNPQTASSCRDATVSYLRADRTGLPQTARLTARLGSAGSQALPEGVTVSFFAGDPAAGGELLGTAVSSMILAPGRYEDLSVNWANPRIAQHALYVLADYGQQLEEIIETNNVLTATVDFTRNDPPVAQAGEDQLDLSKGAAVYLNGTASYDPEGKPLTWKWNLVGLPTGSQAVLVNAHTATPAFLADAAGTYLIELVVNDGLQDSSPDRVMVKVIDPAQNRRPDILSTPDFVAFAGKLYNYQVVAADPDMDPLTYSLSNSPSGMTISATGLLGFTPPNQGQYPVQIIVKDNKGALVSQAYTLTVIPYQNYAPSITSAPPVKAQVGELFTYTPTAVDYNKDVLTWTLVTGPAGMTINPSTGQISWTPTLDNLGTHAVKIEVKDAGGAGDAVAFSLVVVLDAANSPVVSSIPDRVVMDPQQFGPIPLDSYVADPNYPDDQITWTVSGNEALTVQISADRIATVTYQSGARVSESLTFLAKNPDGFTGFATARYTVRGADQPPRAAMANLKSDEVNEIREGRFKLYGTADDPDAIDAVAWRLSLYNSKGQWIQDLTPGTVDEDGFTNGRIPAGGLLAELDFSNRQNGVYDLYLDVKGGAATATAHATISLQSDLKLGHLSFTQNDIVLSVGGLPLSVTRTYNSLTAGSGDFGYCWTYSISDLELDIDETRVQTKDLFGDSFSLRTGGGRNITINMPDTGKRVTFYADFETGGMFKTQVVWRAPKGVNATLVPTVSSNIISLFTLPPYWEAAGMNTSLENFDFPGYLLTTKDGTRYHIQRHDEGEHFLAEADNYGDYYVHAYSGGYISKIEKRDGERIEIVREGEGLKRVDHYQPDNKKTLSLVFTRDSLNRITEVYDPAGLDAQGKPQGLPALKYEYDASGNLIKFHKLTDASDPQKPVYATTTYYYEDPRRPHYITQIKDPEGKAPMRTEYDADGRMVATIDAYGNRTEFQHDDVSRTQTVFDRNGNPTLYLYDDRGNILSTTDSLGRTTLRTFDVNNRQLSETNPRGYTTTYAYDGLGNRIAETDPLGNTWLSTYDSNNQLVSSRSPNGYTRSITYDAAGHVLTESDFSGNVTSYTYDSAGRKISMTNALGETTTYAYNNLGQLISETDPLGRTTTYTYDTNGNKTSTSIIRTRGDGSREKVTHQFLYDRANRLIQTIDPYGKTTSYVYNGNDRKIMEIDELGLVTIHDYNDRGELVRTIYPDGASESFTYDPMGNRIRTVNANGQATHYSFDAAGRVTKITYPDGSTVESVYDGAGNLLQRKDERGNTTTYEYDAANRNTKVIDALGNITTYDYDKNGNIVKMTDALNHTTQYQYDAHNRRTRVIYHDNTFRQYSYDALGRKVAETDQAGRTTTFQYDKGGRLESVTDAQGRITRYGYDELDNRIFVTDAAGRTTRYEYDALRRKIREITPEGKTTQYTYDAAGNLETVTDADGLVIRYVYDKRHRVVLRDISDGTSTSYTYDKVGNQLTATDAEGVITTTWDSRNRVKRVDHPDATFIEYTYDAAGNQTAILTPYQKTVYTYDSLNRLTEVSTADGDSYIYAYDKVGNRTSLKYANGIEVVYTYDDLNRLISLTNKKTTGGAVLSSYTYTLGPTGIRTKVVENTGRTVDYTYDELYRLTRETIKQAGVTTTIDYTYDEVGNRKSKTTTTADGSTTVTYAYDKDDRLLSETLADGSLTTYTYDAKGRTIAKTIVPVNGAPVATTYGYDGLGRLKTVSTAGLQTVAYRYNAHDQRIRETTAQADRKFLVDTNRSISQVLLETTINGTVLAEYTYGKDLLRMNRRNVKSSYLFDGHMSVRQLTNDSAAITDTYTYDAFGVLFSSTGSTDNAYRYNAQHFDANTGFYNLRARLYYPDIGRFITRDEHPGNIYDPVTLHDYLYAGCNPINNVDPNGRFFSLASFSVSVVSIQEIQINYAFMMLNIFLDVMRIAENFFEPAAVMMDRAVEMMGLPWLDNYAFELMMRSRDLQALGFQMISSAIQARVKGFAQGLILPVKLKWEPLTVEWNLGQFLSNFFVDPSNYGNYAPSIVALGVLQNLPQAVVNLIDSASKDLQAIASGSGDSNTANTARDIVMTILRDLAVGLATGG